MQNNGNNPTDFITFAYYLRNIILLMEVETSFGEMMNPVT
jgi:hypothetical protein